MKNIKEPTYSLRHKILSWAVLIGIFICGVIIGATTFQSRPMHKGMELANKNAIEAFVERNNMPCRVKEEKLQQMLTENDHWYNARIYERMEKIGCEQNKEKFANFAKSELELAEAIRYVEYGEENISVENNENAKPCAIIERQLRYELDRSDNASAWSHSRNAAVYSKMSEDGCPENSEKYKQLALNELEIADGIKVRENNVSEDEMLYTVDTYKKLQMQQEAKKYINKVEKMVNPGIDFIMELQRIIEE